MLFTSISYHQTNASTKTAMQRKTNLRKFNVKRNYYAKRGGNKMLHPSCVIVLLSFTLQIYTQYL